MRTAVKYPMDLPSACSYLRDPANFTPGRIFDIEIPVAQLRIKEDAHRIAGEVAVEVFTGVSCVGIDDDDFDANYNEVYATALWAAGNGIRVGCLIASQEFQREGYING